LKAAILACTTLTAALAACSNTPTAPAARTSLVAVAPTGGATAVSPTTAVTITFSHAMMPGMQTYADLHSGSVTGPVVSCIATWSGDSTTLTLTPMTPLAHGTMYTLHMGGGMKDATGQTIDMSQYGPMMGGDWADGGMMTGGGMMNTNHDEMGPGWQGTNGMYGMIFSFTTS
jgi:Big-like domain-containing protein